MKKTLKRAIALVISLVLCLCSLPETTRAAEKTDINDPSVHSYYGENGQYYDDGSGNQWYDDLCEYKASYFNGEEKKIPAPFYTGNDYNDSSSYLIEGTDYTVTYENNTEVGIATATYTGIGDYTGTRVLKFGIEPMNISDNRVNNLEVIPNYDWPVVYDGQPHDFTDVTVKVNGIVLKKGTDYTVGYSYRYVNDEDREAWEAEIDGFGGRVGYSDKAVRAPIEISFIGNYSGSWESYNTGTTSLSGYATEYQYYIMPHVDSQVSKTYTVNPGTDNEIQWTWTLGTDGTMTVNGAGSIPYDLTLNGDVGWRDYSPYVKKIIVGNGVTEISGGAFREFKYLKEVILPGSVEVIGPEAFYSCRSLKSIHTPDTNMLPSALREIWAKAFGGNCYNLEVHLPDNVSFIEHSNGGYDRKIYCTHGSTTEQSMKSSTTNVFRLEGEEYDGFWFYWDKVSGDDPTLCMKLYGKYDGHTSEAVIPDFVESLQDTFNYCNWITHVTIPASVKSFPGFMSCYRLESVDILPGNTMILYDGFLNDCWHVTISIPDSITEIEAGYLAGSYDHIERSRTVIVGEDSAAYQWAVDNNWEEDNGSDVGYLYRIRRVTQPSITPSSVSLRTDSIDDLNIRRADGDFTFDSVKNGNDTLILNTDYTVVGNIVTIKKAYLKTLDSGTTTLTFHYTGTAGKNNDILPEDPTLGITITKMASPVLTVTGKEDTDVTDDCMVVWKDGNTVVDEPVHVLAGKALTYTITPGDALKESDGILYYKETTGAVTLLELDQKVDVVLNQQGTITVNPKDGGNEITDGYTIRWYTLRTSDDRYISAGANGVTSPVMDVGTTLYYDIIMSGDNATDYENVEKSPVEVVYGNSVLDHDLTGKNNITLNISGTKRSGGSIKDDDYVVTWYKKDGNSYKKTYITGSKLINLSDKVGTEYYYEITPKDYRNGTDIVYNWLEFHGIPASEATKVTVTDKPQNIDVSLSAVKTVSLSGTVANAGVVGADNLTFTLTQEPWSNYQGGNTYYSYSDIWNDMVIANNNGNFSALVYDFDTTLKVVDIKGNFRAAYQTQYANRLTDFLLTMEAEPLPDSLALDITRTYPASGDANYATSTLSYGYNTEGVFADMSFALYNVTKSTAISSDLYTVTPAEIRFVKDDKLNEKVSMGDKLKLTVSLADGTDAVLSEDSSELIVRRKYGTDEDRSFKLSYKEYGNVSIKTQTGSRINQTYAIYDKDGKLCDTGAFRSDKAESNQIPAGTYTVCVWRDYNWINAAATLSGLRELLADNEFQSLSINIENGRQTDVNMGVSPEISERQLFTDDSGFTDSVVNASIEEWTLVSLAYEVDPKNILAHPDSQFAIQVTTNIKSSDMNNYPIVPRYSDSHTYNGDAIKDKYISLYSGGALTESRVKVDFYDVNHLTPLGFTVYTDKTSGVIYFYVKSSKGGDYPITAEGIRFDNKGMQVQKAALSGMTLSVTALSSKLSFTSDYLRTIDNGMNRSNYNGVWLYTNPNSEVDLYMDDVLIMSQTSASNGVAAFSFAMSDTKIGKADISRFRAIDPDWRLAGSHEIYAVTDVNGEKTRSATSVMECVTRENYTPAVITKVEVTSYSDYESDPFTGRKQALMEYRGVSNAPYLTAYYWSLNDKGNVFTYQFDATVDDADNLSKDAAPVLYVTSQDGMVHSVIMEREGNTNVYTGSVSGEHLLFTNWSVDVTSAKPESVNSNSMLFALDDMEFTDVLNMNTVLIDPDGNSSTVKAEYNRITNEINNKVNNNTLASEQREYFDDNAEMIDEMAKLFEDEGFKLDGSEESIEAMLEFFGYTIGVAADVDYASWGDDYASATLPDGREMRARTTVDKQVDGSYLYTATAVVLPKDDDPGYSQIQRIVFKSGSQSAGTNNSPRTSFKPDPNLLRGNGGSNSLFPTYDKDATSAVNKLNNMFKKAYQKYSGRPESGRDSMNWSQRMQMLSGPSDGYGQHQKQTKANLTMQNRLNDLLDLGPEKLGNDNYNTALECRNNMKSIMDKSQYADIGSALSYMINAATEYSVSGKMSKFLTNLSKDYLAKKFEEKFGFEMPTSLMGAGDLLARLYFSNMLTKEEAELFETLIKLNKLANNLGVGGNMFEGSSSGSTCGGSARAIHDPAGIVYEAVLSNPVENATVTIWERKTDGTESTWDAADYGQVNPQITNASGQYQWFVPEGEWQVRVKAPSGYSDNTSAGNAAANLNDGSTAGWLPVMPVQLGINIPLVSTSSPAVSDIDVTDNSVTLTFSLYMDVSTLNDSVVYIKSGDSVIPCTINFPDSEADPADSTKTYAKTARLTASANFNKQNKHTVYVTTGAIAYNGKHITSAYSNDIIAGVTATPTPTPTAVPTPTPTTKPTDVPTAQPTSAPTTKPTEEPKPTATPDTPVTPTEKPDAPTATATPAPGGQTPGTNVTNPTDSGNSNTSAKLDNPLTLKGKKATIKFAKLKKKKITLAFKKVIAVSNAQGTVTFAKVKGNKKITINKKSGKVTVKKGLKKGRYSVKVNITAAGNDSYKEITKAITFKLTVK